MARQAIELDILGLPPAVSLEYPNQEAMDQRFLLAQKQREGVALRRQELALRQMAEMQELPTPTPTPTLNPNPNPNPKTPKPQNPKTPSYSICYCF